MKKHAQCKVYIDESRLFYAALSTFFVVFFAYVYFVSASIADVVMRKEVDSQIAELGTSISQLESEYIEMQHSVSNDIATHRGFVAVDTKVFIDKAQGDALVMHTN